jgi:hypothetical protein
VSAEVAERQQVGGGSPGQTLILRCAWCGRIKVDDAWIAAADSAALEPTPETVDERSDGICPDCHAKLESDLPL